MSSLYTMIPPFKCSTLHNQDSSRYRACSLSYRPVMKSYPVRQAALYSQRTLLKEGGTATATQAQSPNGRLHGTRRASGSASAS